MYGRVLGGEVLLLELELDHDGAIAHVDQWFSGKHPVTQFTDELLARLVTSSLPPAARIW